VSNRVREAGLTAATLPDALFDAFETARPLAAELLPALTLADAYLVQEALVARHVARGRAVGGWKLGMTNLERRGDFGATEPTHATLLRELVLHPGDAPLTHDFVAPRIEPEFAFVLIEDLERTPTHAELRRVSRVAPAFELLDSRVTPFPSTLPPGIADNAAGAGAVVGTPVPWDELDLGSLHVSFRRGGEELAHAAGAVISGDPAAPALWFAQAILAGGGRLPAGTVVLTGGITAAFPLEPGAFRADFGPELGSVSLTVEQLPPGLDESSSHPPGGSPCRLRISLT
jgi:2-oxo-3-hexenedioate decarboxylase